FEYDDAGRLWRRTRGLERWEFEYDGDDQLIRVSRNGELVASYDYDLVNRRMRKVMPTGTTSYLYDGSWALRAERNGDRTIRPIYLPGLGIPLATYLDDGACYYYGIDQLGDPIEAWSEDGQLAAMLSQEAYGTERVVRRLIDERVPFPFLFPGQY